MLHKLSFCLCFVGYVVSHAVMYCIMNAGITVFHCIQIFLPLVQSELHEHLLLQQEHFISFYE
jgi:hypothetical protein